MTRRRGILILSLCGLAAILALLLWYRQDTINQKHGPDYGVTFSTQYAKSLGVDWQKAYFATLDDLGVRKLRIPVYWDDIESQRGHEEWGEVDWMLYVARDRGADVILVIGRKTPRWPECHVPGWAEKLGEVDQRKEVMRFLKDEVEHFKGFAPVKVWQVENEPLFQFGKCPLPDREFFKSEVALVRSLDPRPIMVTDSGELSTWIRTGSLGDILGISMYRLVWNKYLGELYWPVSPFYYTDRMNFMGPVVKKVIISELQAEPWFVKPPAQTPIADQLAQMNAQRLNDNADFAASTGASEIYLWGVEWWYWLKTQGHEELWIAARGLFP